MLIKQEQKDLVKKENPDEWMHFPSGRSLSKQADEACADEKEVFTFGTRSWHKHNCTWGLVKSILPLRLETNLLPNGSKELNYNAETCHAKMWDFLLTFCQKQNGWLADLKAIKIFTCTVGDFRHAVVRTGHVKKSKPHVILDLSTFFISILRTMQVRYQISQP